MASSRSLFRNLALIALAGFALAACSDARTARNRGIAPIPAKLLAEMKAKGMTRSSPVLVRIYKQESELEVWKQTGSGRYALLKSYPICRWSGQLGPKKNEGDRQVPEGFYTVSSGQLNPNSRYYLSFDVGYPNSVDASLGRSGGDIMVHGACSSRGCFAMTDQEMGEIYAVAREALQAGQPSFQLQSYPFRMTAENFAKQRKNPNIGFWRNLKEGADTFEVTKQPVTVAACGGRYAFGGTGGCNLSAPDPSVVAAVTEKQRRDDERIASLVSSGTPAVNVIYEDGGSHPSFATRSVDSKSIPGQDRPYNKVLQPTQVALNDAGAPATEADQKAAASATYSAAETLLMSEAIIKRRPSGPQNPTAIATRQQTVYSRLMGGSMPKPVPQKPAAPEVVVAAASPAPAAAPSAGEAQSDAPLYERLLAFASFDSTPKPPAATASTATLPSAPVHASMAPAPASSPAQDEQPFYSRWLGLGGSEAQPVAQAPAAAADVPADGSIVPVPPSRPRTAALPGKKRPLTAEDLDTFTSLGN